MRHPRTLLLASLLVAALPAAAAPVGDGTSRTTLQVSQSRAGTLAVVTLDSVSGDPLTGILEVLVEGNVMDSKSVSATDGLVFNSLVAGGATGYSVCARFRGTVDDGSDRADTASSDCVATVPLTTWARMQLRTLRPVAPSPTLPPINPTRPLRR